MVSLWIFDAALFFSVFIHEVGHALMAQLVGVRITKFRFGFGPLLLRLGMFEWRLVPISGEVRTEERMAPWKGVLIALAGVMMQWAVVIAAMVMGMAKMDVTFWAWGLGMAMMGLLNLVPLGKTDGAVMVRWLKTSHDASVGR